MNFNDLDSIITCMKEWVDIRNNPTEVLKYLNTGNYFSFDRNNAPVANIHVYPGIDTGENQFYMFMIDANIDVYTSSDTELFNAVTICKVVGNLGDPDEVTPDEAKSRIANWKKHYNSWATSQIDNQSVTEGIFKAFNMPSSYMAQGKNYTTFFGLKPNHADITGYNADLITVEMSKTKTTYFDTVRPVPPFDVIPESDFYLLSKI